MKKFLVLTLLSVFLLSACAPRETFQHEWPTPVATFTPESGMSGVSSDLDLSDLTGKCVRIAGTIETYEGRPAIIIKSRDQILPCLGKK